jgi:hypothetical protein
LHQARINFAKEGLQIDWRQIGKHHAIEVPNAWYYRRVWRRSHNAIQKLIPHKNAWLCIHRYEGSWQDNGSPYWGGLQMDYGFQKAYGYSLLKTKGTANNWTPLEQMAVAENAYYSGRGFYPWPNTARSCGLI